MNKDDINKELTKFKKIKTKKMLFYCFISEIKYPNSMYFYLFYYILN